jgi:endonuclease/exonuclease/phosphatase family metal-dependent hydrolase
VKHRIAPFFVLLAAISCVPTPARAPAAVASKALTVMTYNIRSGNGDLAATANTIRGFSPDIVGLQEVDVHWSARSNFADQATELGRMLGMNVRFAHIYDLPPDTTGHPSREFGVALLSRYPVTTWRNDTVTRLSTQEANPIPKPMPGLLEAVLEVSGRPLRVFVTHLDYRADPHVRELQVADMLRYIGGDTLPTLLFGDLNATPEAAELQPLMARLHDVWPEQSGSGFTYPAEKPEKRIDYILASDFISVQSPSVPVTLASDHRPVVAHLIPLWMQLESSPAIKPRQ